MKREDIEWLIEKYKPSSFRMGDFYFEASPYTYLVEGVEEDESDPISQEEYDSVKKQKEHDEYMSLLGHSSDF